MNILNTVQITKNNNNRLLDATKQLIKKKNCCCCRQPILKIGPNKNNNEKEAPKLRTVCIIIKLSLTVQ